LLRFLAHDFTVDLRVERGQQFGVVSGERKFEIARPDKIARPVDVLSARSGSAAQR